MPPLVHLTDLDYADDLAIIADKVQNAEDFLHALEEVAACVGLHYNETKTEFISTTPNTSVSTFSGKILKHIKDCTLALTS